jgi:hypothetical protein
MTDSASRTGWSTGAAGGCRTLIGAASGAKRVADTIGAVRTGDDGEAGRPTSGVVTVDCAVGDCAIDRVADCAADSTAESEDSCAESAAGGSSG